jgi:hypothetical protein
VLIATLLAALLVAACSRSEQADDLAAMKGPGDQPAGLSARGQMKELIACCDDNARAMGAECCLELDRLRQGQPGAPSGMPTGMTEGPSFKSGRPAQIDPAVAARWPRVKLRVGPKTGGGEEVVITVGQKAAIPGTALEVEVTAFTPAFKMTREAIVADGAEPTNPAAKVVIREPGKPEWSGWLFAKMPDVHAFDHPTLKVVLVGGVEAKGAKP